MSEHLAQHLMDQFIEATGISGNLKPRRYLWTDAYAVCNLLGLAQRTGDDRYRSYAAILVDQVHHVLGRHRDDDERRGWLSGLSEQQGEQHPTLGGLRIGKTFNERGPNDVADPRLEWDRDGQYFHYLTKWAHALFLIGRDTSEKRYFDWAHELMLTAHNAFTYSSVPQRPKRMYWKMSIDLSRPLVSAMGQHDPLDGLLSCLELLTASELKGEMTEKLADTVDELAEICELSSWKTDDPLGIGGLLDAATRLGMLVYVHGLDGRRLLYQLMIEAELSLKDFCHTSSLILPVEQRLAFRELGLSIGLRGLQKIKTLVSEDAELVLIHHRLMRFEPLAEQIESIWSNSVYRLSRSWSEHLDINRVMLATSLIPDGYFAIVDSPCAR